MLLPSGGTPHEIPGIAKKFMKTEARKNKNAEKPLDWLAIPIRGILKDQMNDGKSIYLLTEVVIPFTSVQW